MSGDTTTVIILGATSNIAEATARLYAEQGASIVLAGRRKNALEEIRNDLTMRGSEHVTTHVVDFVEADAGQELETLSRDLGRVDHIVLAYGLLGDHESAEHDPDHAREIIDVNFRSAAIWTLACTSLLVKQGTGSLVVLGSVAGDRGRRGNYIYGAAKSGLATLVEGIAHQIGNQGPRVAVVKPGPTDTAMTRGMDKGGPFWAKPEQIARTIYKAGVRGGPVLYSPARWRWIMHIIKSIPFFIFRKMTI